MFDKIKNGLIVSCQALPDEPLHSSFIMGKMALAAKEGGAVGIRAQGKEDILEIRKNVDLPVIGIIKRNYPDSDIYITPTKLEIDELLATGCEMIAIDATLRDRPGGEKLADLVRYVKESRNKSRDKSENKNSKTFIMADCSTYEEAKNAEELGFDCVSTTLCGYTAYSENIPGPNLSLIARLLKDIRIPVIAEGKINTPQDLKAVMTLGCHAAVVGGAITRPQQITARFVAEGI